LHDWLWMLEEWYGLDVQMEYCRSSVDIWSVVSAMGFDRAFMQQEVVHKDEAYIYSCKYLDLCSCKKNWVL
jgi:hypothetical protein